MSETSTPVVTKDDLEQQREFLLASLADLDAEWDSGDIAEADYVALKDDYTARAAAVLRALVRLEDEPAAVITSQANRARRPVWPLVVSGLLVLAVAVGAGVLVTRTSGERLPGQPASGGPDSGVSALLEQATQLDQRNDVLGAVKLYDAVLKKDPENVVALAYKGWMLGRQPNAELVAKGQESLDRAVKVDPTFADAHVFRGLVLVRNKRPAEGVCELRMYLAIAPPGGPMTSSVETALDEATKQAGGKVADCPNAVKP